MTVAKMVENGICIGCGACADCKHISFEKGRFGFPVPVVGKGCVACGKCVMNCPVCTEETADD